MVATSPGRLSSSSKGLHALLARGPLEQRRALLALVTAGTAAWPGFRVADLVAMPAEARAWFVSPDGLRRAGQHPVSWPELYRAPWERSDLLGLVEAAIATGRGQHAWLALGHPALPEREQRALWAHLHAHHRDHLKRHLGALHAAGLPADVLDAAAALIPIGHLTRLPLAKVDARVLLRRALSCPQAPRPLLRHLLDRDLACEHRRRLAKYLRARAANESPTAASRYRAWAETLQPAAERTAGVSSGSQHRYAFARYEPSTGRPRLEAIADGSYDPTGTWSKFGVLGAVHGVEPDHPVFAAAVLACAEELTVDQVLRLLWPAGHRVGAYTAGGRGPDPRHSGWSQALFEGLLESAMAGGRVAAATVVAVLSDLDRSSTEPVARWYDAAYRHLTTNDLGTSALAEDLISQAYGSAYAAGGLRALPALDALLEHPTAATLPDLVAAAVAAAHT